MRYARLRIWVEVKGIDMGDGSKEGERVRASSSVSLKFAAADFGGRIFSEGDIEVSDSKELLRRHETRKFTLHRCEEANKGAGEPLTFVHLRPNPPSFFPSNVQPRGSRQTLPFLPIFSSTSALKEGSLRS